MDRPIGLFLPRQWRGAVGDHFINAIKRYNSRGNGFSTGWFLSKIETSISPYCARASERGMGVGVITKTSTPPLLPQFHAAHAKRCCSSIMASRRSETHIALKRAWCQSEYEYPHGQARPVFAPFASLVPPRQQFNHHLRILGQGASASGAVGKDFGRGIKTPCPPSSTAINRDRTPPRFSPIPHRPATIGSCDADRPYPP